MANLNINGKSVEVDAAPDTPLLWALRDHLAMTGTKFGCGAALCGACTVHVEGAPTRSCVTPISAVMGKKITTIEGLNGRVAEAVQAFVGQDPGAAVRLLPERAGDGRHRAAHQDAESDRRADR
jgi:aerobic-type carbon monoxide dehydrogenase small subunit (CoxS/CutS family)